MQIEIEIESGRETETNIDAETVIETDT